MPQNKGEHLTIWEGVRVKLFTDPVEIAIIASECTWGDPWAIDVNNPELRSHALEQINAGKTLGVVNEVPALGFLCKASRATMDQVLRMREAGAVSHTTRDNDFRDFNIILPDAIRDLFENDDPLYKEIMEMVAKQRKLYGKMIDEGIAPQDARYIALPQGYQGSWMHIMNIRAFEKMCNQRLCQGLTQHETNYLTRLMRDQAVRKYPEFAPKFVSMCEKRGQCNSMSMLLPTPCGSFGSEPAEFDSEKHLYPPETDPYRLVVVDWDRQRKFYEEKDEKSIFSMSTSPQAIAEKP